MATGNDFHISVAFISDPQAAGSHGARGRTTSPLAQIARLVCYSQSMYSKRKVDWFIFEKLLRNYMAKGQVVQFPKL